MTAYLSDRLPTSTRPRVLNVSYRRVGGLRFVKLGRLTVSFSVSKAFAPIKGA